MLIKVLLNLVLIKAYMEKECILQTLFITRLSMIFTLFMVATVSFSYTTWAQIIAPSAAEVKFSYKTTFQVPINHGLSTEKALAEFHASHIFGIFASPAIISKYIGPNAITSGIGGPRVQMRVKILSKNVSENIITIKYANSGKMILNKTTAKKIISKGVLELPLPTNPYEIYDEKCTDKHYSSFDDYWYFYDPFREGCENLIEKPLATKVQIKITPSEYKKIDLTPKLPILRGNNDNGDLFSVYIITGYHEATDRKDLGYISFEEIRDSFVQRGFEVSSKRPHTKKPLDIYKKQIELDNGKIMDVVVKHLLVDTDIEARTLVFAKFFKEAVAQADVIIYGGHSGLGANLDLPFLEEKAGKFEFNTKKKQIFFFDSCSSYSYYLEHFAVEKTKAKIDIMTNGLASDFRTSTAVLSAFLDHLFTTDSSDVFWMNILTDMENTLDGNTYLLNVGGI